MKKQLIKMTHPLPDELLAAMKDLSNTIVHWDSPDKGALYGLAKGFYSLVTDEKHWETIILCMMCINNSKTSSDFEYEIQELTCHIPSILVQGEQDMEVFYMYDGVFSAMPLSARNAMAKALKNLMTRALASGHVTLIEYCVEWNRCYMINVLPPDLLKASLAYTEVPLEVRELVLWQIGGMRGFDTRTSYDELKQLCKSIGLPMSSYLGIVAENELSGNNDENEFAKEVAMFNLLKDEDFDQEDLDLQTLCTAIAFMMADNGDNIGFENTNSGIGLINSVYDQCCQYLKSIIQESLVEVKRLIAKQGRKTVIVTNLPLGACLRDFSSKERKLLDELIAKKEEKSV